ncbi:MAG TPA: DNA ligase (NAD(+)) LigA [Lachnospiraceae bacterium]|nr:DNA ligase (NAD(+)) LigA [Lachnospiraceae bacterium]
MDKISRMKELIEILNEASRAYYAEDREIMSNFEYDKLYDELVSLEEDTGTVLSSSPTVKIGYEAVDELPKEAHESPMLSLDKTKDREALREWLKDKEGLLSWKLDGLTIVLTYRDGSLFKAVTRGNGEIGEVITGNARTFVNLPHSIPYKGELILRGEAVISYTDFDRINETIEDIDARYKNPRNLCSGSVRQLNNEVTAARSVRLYAFTLVKADGVDFKNSRREQMEFLKNQGFEVVEYHVVNESDILERIQYFADAVTKNDIPSDGLVLTYDDIEYGRSLGRTAKFPRDAIAFKWQDEIRETKLLKIEWSPSRTGLINPVAIFEPVELEGTTVQRASVHNVSIVKDLKLGTGDTITVYKANMIIPQIAENKTCSGRFDQDDGGMIPDKCPACGGKTEIRKINDTEALYCINPDCPAKKIKSFTLFVSRDAMNIDGLSENTLEKFIGEGYIHEYADIFRLSAHKDELCKLEGFGEKSYNNLISAIDSARIVLLPKLIYSLGIPNVGLSNARIICREFDYDLDKVRHATIEELSGIDKVGGVIAGSFVDYFKDERHNKELDELINELTIEVPELDSSNEAISGKTFVITGSLEHYENRNALKDFIESKGGKVSGSVSAKTDYLINNDITSNSSKNKKAKELGVKIITEDDFLQLSHEESRTVPVTSEE